MTYKDCLSNIYIVIILIAFNFILRLIFPYWFFLINPKYRFLNSYLPYYYEADSFYYAKILEGYLHSRLLVYLLPLLLIILTIAIIYYTLFELTHNKTESAIYSLLITTFPYFYNQSLIGLIDTSIVLMFCMSLLVYSIVLLFAARDKLTIVTFCWLVIFPTSLLLFLVWAHSFYMLGILLFSIIASKYFTKYWHYIASLLFVFIIFINTLKFKELLEMKSLGVAEYLTPDYFPYYFIFIFIVIIILINNELISLDSQRDKFMAICFLIFFAISFVFMRFGNVAILFGGLYLSKIKYHKIKHYKTLFLIIILINVIFLGVVYSEDSPIMNRDKEIMFNSITESIPVVSYWDNGYYIKYFTNNTALYRASPERQSINAFCSMLNKSDSKELDILNLTKPYYIYIAQEDYCKCHLPCFNKSSYPSLILAE